MRLGQIAHFRLERAETLMPYSSTTGLEKSGLLEAVTVSIGVK